MSTSNSEPLTTEQQFYCVELSATGQPSCQCENCQLWTITYDDGEPTEIGTSWQGPGGKEAAKDVCDLMNMAYDAGKEAKGDPDLLAALKELLASEMSIIPPFEAGKDAQDAWADRRARARNDAAFAIYKTEGEA